MENRWYDDPMRICAFQWSLGERTFEAPAVAGNGGFNVEQVCHVLEEQSLAEIYDVSKHEEKLSRYVAESKKHGMRLIIYFNAHCVFPGVISENPSWAQTGSDGIPARAYGTYLFTCVNSPWRDYFMQSVDNLMRQEVDGLFLDGPIFGEEACFCDSCSRLFQEEFGHNLRTASARERISFKTGSINRFVRDVRAVIGRCRPDAILYANNTGLAQNVTGCTIDGLFPYVDFIGTEGGFIFYGDPNQVSLWKGSQNANYLEGKSRGKPYVIFTAGNHCSWARSVHSPEETTLLFASAVANGANVWYGIHGPLFMMDTRGGQAAGAFNRFLARNERFYRQTRRCAEVALVWSRQTLDCFPEDVEESDFTRRRTLTVNQEHGRFSDEFKSFIDLLIRSHIQVAIIDESNLTDEDLAQYRMLVLPNAACLDSASAACITRYVGNGGTLFATMATSFFDEAGNRLDRPSLADVLGILKIESVHHYDNGCGYLSVEDPELLRQGGVAPLTGGFSTALQCAFQPHAERLASMHMPMAGSYDAFPEDKFATVTRTAYGKGKSLYFAGDVGATMTQHGLVELRRMVSFLLNHSMESQFAVANAYGSLEVEIRRQQAEKRMLVHFVNYTGQMQRPIDGIIPCHDIEVAIRTEDPVLSVYLLQADKPADFTISREGIRFTVPRVDLYELAVVQFG